MNQETLKQFAETNGYTIEFERYEFTFESQETRLSIGTRLDQSKLTYDFRLTGPPPSHELMYAIIAYGESEAEKEKRAFCFTIYHFRFRHPDYYCYGPHHAKVCPLEDWDKKTAELFYPLYKACVEEEENDALFDWEFGECYPNIDLAIVKTGERIVFNIVWKESTYVMQVSPFSTLRYSEEFGNKEDCITRVKEIIHKTDRTYRLSTVFDTSRYYTERFLRRARFFEESFEPVFHHFQQSHAAEEIELYFKQLEVSHVPYVPNEISQNYCLIQVLDTWIINNGAEGVIFLDSCTFNEALDAYQKQLMKRMFDKNTTKKIEKYKTSR